MLYFLMVFMYMQNLQFYLPTIKELESVSRRDLYEYYKELFSGKYRVDVVCYGELDSNMENNIDKIII